MPQAQAPNLSDQGVPLERPGSSRTEAGSPGVLVSKPNPFTPVEDPGAWRLTPEPQQKGGHGDTLVAFGSGALLLAVASLFAWLMYLAFR